jgi:hypothetical protein
MTRREQNYMAIILDVVDAHDDVAMPDIYQALRHGINFPDYVLAVNRLIDLGLIWIDPNHVAHRVKT